MESPNLVQIFGSYQAWQGAEDTWFINFMNGSENMYLLEGTEKALLIDTGWGAGNLRQFVEKLTDKPISVVNTHFHPDHAGGNGEFSSVMVSAGWVTDMPSMKGDLAPFDFDRLPHPDYQKVVVGEGTVIDLGNRTVEIMDVQPAHCNSSLFLFDRANGLFFTGDELEAGQVNLFDNSRNTAAPYNVARRLENARANYARIKALEDRITMLLPNHNGFPIAFSYVDDFLGLIDHIYQGDALIEDKLNHPFIDKDPKAPFLCRVRWNKASIFIRKDEVMKVYGQERQAER